MTCAALLGTLLAAGTAHADERVDLGIFGGAHVFSESNELGAYETDHTEAPSNAVMAGLRIGVALNWMFSIEAEVGGTRTTTRGMADAAVDTYSYRAHVLAHFTRADSDNRPFAVLGGGFMQGDSYDDRVLMDDFDEELYAGVGYKHYFGSWGLRADARILFPPATDSDFVTTDFEAFASVYYAFGRKRAERIEVEPVIADSDGDGIKDDVDQCKDSPEDIDGFEDDDGCPEVDNDGDGIADNDDDCPLVAETKNGIDDDDGCPEDDADGDGIADADDKCVDQPETKNGYEDEDGCPDVVPKAVRKFTGTIKGITFEKNKDVIRPTSHKVLDAAVKVLNDYPNLRIEIQGHTDNRGSEQHNSDLSQRRADAVKAYLVEQGIDEGRIEAKGYGEESPIANNGTKAGRAKNRRVEFVLIPNP